MCSIWNRMAAVSVVDLQYAETDFGQDILKFKALEIVMYSTVYLKKKKKELNLKLVWKNSFTWFDLICTFVLNYDKMSPS